MSYATNSAVRPSAEAAAVAVRTMGPGSVSPAGHSAAGRSAIRRSTWASAVRPSRSHSSICRAAGLSGSTQKGEAGAGFPFREAAPATEASSTSAADVQPAASPSIARAARGWISRDMLLP